MQPLDNLRAFLIGETSLLLRCTELLLERRWVVEGIVSRDVKVGKWALLHGILWHRNDGDLLPLMQGCTFDYLFSVVNGLPLTEEMLSCPRMSCINYHDSLLPRSAGVNAVPWALVNGEKEHGITWHLMTARIDAGEILKQTVVPIADSDTALTLNVKCYEAGADIYTCLPTWFPCHNFHIRSERQRRFDAWSQD